MSVASRSIMCRCRRQRQIIDLRAIDIDILREPSSIIVLFTYQASFYIFLYSFSESSAKRAAIVYKVEANAHAQSIICSWGRFLTNARAQTIICTQLFAGKLTNQSWENNKVNDNKNYLPLKRFPRISLDCKLVPVQYWEYEYGLLFNHLRAQSARNKSAIHLSGIY